MIFFSEIKKDHPFDVKIPDHFFPLVQVDITECSTYAVVCRLKASPTYTITSCGGSLSHPDFPGVTVTIPENAVTPTAKHSLELKVGLFKYIPYLSHITSKWFDSKLPSICR